MELAALDLSDAEIAGDLLALQRRAYSIEAELIGSDGIPLLRESLEGLQSCGETFLGGFVDGRLVGAASWRFDGETLDLHRLVVDPA